jgi:hypothetical protein
MRHDLNESGRRPAVHGQTPERRPGSLWKDRFGSRPGGASDSRTAWSRAATASSSVPEIVQPAASRGRRRRSGER